MSEDPRCSTQMDDILDEFRSLFREYYDYNPSTIPLHHGLPNALDFCKQVHRGQPCIYTLPEQNEWSKALAWTADYLCGAVQEPVAIATTPNGQADALYRGKEALDGIFLEPAEELMTLRSLFRCLHTPNAGQVRYLQSQNSNLTATPLKSLIERKDVPTSIEFADTACGSRPDAVNLWIGTDASVTSFHRDPYENLYVVLKGTKTFRLFPPVAEIALPCKMVRSGRWLFDASTGEFTIQKDPASEEIPWIDIDPAQSFDIFKGQWGLSGHARQQVVEVKAGQMLYLPAGWYHQVNQECGVWPDGSKAPCVAVNYWYDQEYSGEKFLMRQHMTRIVSILKSYKTDGGQED